MLFNYRISKSQKSQLGFVSSPCVVEVAPRVRGFTIAELVVVCGIIGVMSLVVVSGYSKYRGQSLLQSQMYEMRLAVREAQVKGTAVTPQSNSFDLNYGVQFSTASGGLNYFIMSRPVSTGVATALTTFTLARGSYISGVFSCTSSATVCTAKTSVAVYFKRPHYDTDLVVDGATDVVSGSIVVNVTGDAGVRKLTIWRSGIMTTN